MRILGVFCPSDVAVASCKIHVAFLQMTPGCSHSVKTGAVPNEHFNEHTGFDFVVVVVAAAFSLLSWVVLKSECRQGRVRRVESELMSVHHGESRQWPLQALPCATLNRCCCCSSERFWIDNVGMQTYIQSCTAVTISNVVQSNMSNAIGLTHTHVDEWTWTLS